MTGFGASSAVLDVGGETVLGVVFRIAGSFCNVVRAGVLACVDVFVFVDGSVVLRVVVVLAGDCAVVWRGAVCCGVLVRVVVSRVALVAPSLPPAFFSGSTTRVWAGSDFDWASAVAGRPANK
jgi:hypothetical protein